MHYKPEYLVEKGKIRIVSEPKRVKENRVYVPRNPIATILTTFVWSIPLRRRDIKGLEYFDEAVAVYSETDPLTLIGPHSHQRFPLWQRIKEGWTVDLEFGPAFRAEGLWLPETFQVLKKMGASPVDLAMVRIGRIDWERVDPEIRPLHQKICEAFPVVPLAA